MCCCFCYPSRVSVLRNGWTMRWLVCSSLGSEVVKRVDREVPGKNQEPGRRDCPTTTQGELVWSDNVALCHNTEGDSKRTGV
jgi:hypothetical protein